MSNDVPWRMPHNCRPEGVQKTVDRYNLRHSCASYLAMNGVGLLDIDEVLGHRTLTTVKRYSHLTEVHTRNVIQRMSQVIFGEYR